MRRFYDKASVVEAEAGFGIALDGRPARTPGKRSLVVPTRALAEEMAREWAEQGEEIAPTTMGITRLANSAIDVVTHRRADVAAEAARYGSTDLLCYRAEDPPDLAARQDDAWQPLLDWAEARFGVALAVTRSVMPVAQAPAAVEALGRAAASYDVFPLTGLHAATSAAGSIIVGLALAEGRIDTETAFAASQLDETYQIERWGEDAEAAVRRDALRRDLRDAGRFLELCRG